MKDFTHWFSTCAAAILNDLQTELSSSAIGLESDPHVVGCC